jgi:branched-chain amino acid aminotransferase
VIERAMPIGDLLGQLASGECSELFACGTAAIVCPISVIGDADGREYRPAAIDKEAKTLRERLLAIQERRAPDPHGWIREVTPVVRSVSR